MMRNRSFEKGFTLTALLISGVILSILSVSVVRWAHNLRKAERGIATNLDQSEIIYTVRLLTERTEACNTSGMVGLDLSPLLAPSPSPVAVSLRIGATPVVQAGLLSNTRQISSFNVIELNNVSGQSYLAKVNLQTQPTGVAITARNPSANFNIPVNLDAANRVTNCGGNTAAVTSQEPVDNKMNGFRLVLDPANPRTTADQIGRTTVYLAPVFGNRIALFDGTNWITQTSPTVSISVPPTVNTNFDVFAYTDQGVLKLETASWASALNRNINITYRDGILVSFSDNTRRYLGTLRTAGIPGTTEDSYAKRFLWNYYNALPITSSMPQDPTWRWPYGSNNWGPANGGSAYWRTEFVIGIDSANIRVQASMGHSYDCGQSSSNIPGTLGIGLDSQTAKVPGSMEFRNVSQCGQNATGITADWSLNVTNGYHYVQLLTQTNAGNGWCYFYGTNLGGFAINMYH